MSIDHVDYLGSTRESIAADKAGIVKPGAVLVLGETDPALRSASSRPATPPGCCCGAATSASPATTLAHGGRVVDLFTPRARYEDVFVSLHGAHQADNAAIAVAAVEAFADATLPAELVADVLGRVRVARSARGGRATSR